MLFAWCHHNISYDVDAFFNNSVKPSTPASTIARGLAVCEGYAGLYAALAVAAGLQCVVVGGGCKGYGYEKWKAGQAVPAFSPCHAWNAVLIDGGEWKLVDPCWGAGHVQGPGKPYVAKFEPREFEEDNMAFGWRHYPQNKDHFFRTDGTALSWQAYNIGPEPDTGEEVTVYGAAYDEHRLGKDTFLPRRRDISLGEMRSRAAIRFQFAKYKKCPHWDTARNEAVEPPYLFVLSVPKLGSRDPEERERVPFDTDGDVWWCDLPPERLGTRAGVDVQVYAVTHFCGREGRGLTKEEWLGRRCGGWRFGGVACWRTAA